MIDLQEESKERAQKNIAEMMIRAREAVEGGPEAPVASAAEAAPAAAESASEQPATDQELLDSVNAASTEAAEVCLDGAVRVNVSVQAACQGDSRLTLSQWLHAFHC